MKISVKILSFVLICILASAPSLLHAGDKGSGVLGLSVIKVKSKGSWTEVMIAVTNNSDKDIELNCCQVFLENTDGFAVASLTGDEVRTQIHNKAKTVAVIGTILGVGLGLGGAISGHEELGYAAIGTAGGGLIAGAAGEASAEGKARGLVIDDIERNQLFPSGLKVAGTVYFPPKKKWPGSQKAQAVHLSYMRNGKSYRATAPVTSK